MRSLTTTTTAPARGIRSSVPNERVLHTINPLVSAILHSPLHRLLSGRLLLLTFTGRTTGKQFTVPVGYTREGDTLTLFSSKSWGKYLRGGAPVAVLLQGQRRTGRAEVIADRAAKLEAARRARGDLRRQGGRHADRLGARHQPAAVHGRAGRGAGAVHGDAPDPGSVRRVRSVAVARVVPRDARRSSTRRSGVGTWPASRSRVVRGSYDGSASRPAWLVPRPQQVAAGIGEDHNSQPSHAPPD